MELMTKIQAQEYLGLSSATINRLISRGEIDYYKLGQIGQRRVAVKFQKEDLDKWLRGKKVKARAQP